MLQQKNVHNHCLGTAGYEGELKQWEAEDVDLSSKGIPNPWDNFPEGHPRRWLQARSKLVSQKIKLRSSLGLGKTLKRSNQSQKLQASLGSGRMMC
jgi:hypothetical protein